MARAGFQQHGILIEILLFRWQEGHISVKSDFAELGRELGVLLRAAVVVRGAAGTHGSLIDCINNNIQRIWECKQPSSDLCLPQSPSPPTHPCPDSSFKGGTVQNPPLPKKVWNWQEPVSNPFSTAEFPYPPASASCAVNVLLAHSLEQPTQAPAHPCWLLPWGNEPGNSGEPSQALTAATTECPVP